MARTVRIDIVSDVACPWCAFGVASLDHALRRLDGEVTAQLYFEPFELNPHMGPQGQDLAEHLREKFGSTAEEQARTQARLAALGESVGFRFCKEGRGRVWNTFDSHRLLHWARAQEPDRQPALKKALLQAYHGEGRSLADHAVLADAAVAAGLDRAAALAVLASDRYADEVRARELYFRQRGIRGVPSMIVNHRHLIQGAQLPGDFEQVLRKLAA